MSDAQKPRRYASWGPASRTLALVLLECCALVFSLAALTSDADLARVLRENQFPPGAREALLIWLLLAVGFGSLLGAGALWRFGVERVNWWARGLSPVIPAAAIPLLLVSEFWFHQQLDFVLSLLAVTVVFEACLKASFDTLGDALLSLPRPPWLKALAASKRGPLALASVATLAYVLISARITIIDHRRFFTGGYDMAIFDNLMWNALHGEPFKSSIMYGPGPGNSLAGHAEFGMLFFVPIYALAPGSEMMLWIQAAAVGGAALALYFFAQTRIPAWPSALLACAYCLFTPVHGGQHYDFHWLTMCAPFMFLLFYGLSIKKKRWVLPMTAMLFLLREDLAPGIAVLGAFLLLSGARPKFGALLAVSGVVWFAVDKFLIMPYFGTWFFADLYKDLAVPGEPGYGSVIKTLLTNPSFVFRNFLTTPKLLYSLHLLVPLALLPVRRAALLPLLIPGTLFTLLTNWPAALGLGFHYSTHFTPYLFAAAVLVFDGWRSDASSPRVGNFRMGAALGALLLATYCHSYVFGMIVGRDSFVYGADRVRYTLTPAEEEAIKQFESLKKLIPANASITATDYEVPHLSNRRLAFAVGQSLWAGDYFLVGEKSFVLGRTKQNIQTVLTRNPYGFVAKSGPFTLWKKGHKSKETHTERRALLGKMGLLPPRGGPAVRRPAPTR